MTYLSALFVALHAASALQAILWTENGEQRKGFYTSQHPISRTSCTVLERGATSSLLSHRIDISRFVCGYHLTMYKDETQVDVLVLG
jgi:hypothetical protein